MTKESLCRAFDDLEKMEKELGNLYNLPQNNIPSQAQSLKETTQGPIISSPASNMANIVKNVQLLVAKNIAAINNRQQEQNLNETNTNGIVSAIKSDAEDQTEAETPSLNVTLVNGLSTSPAHLEAHEIENFRK